MVEKKYGSIQHQSTHSPSNYDPTMNAVEPPGKSKLGDVVRGSGKFDRGGTGFDILRNWDETEAAKEYEPLPPGKYDAVLVGGGCFTANSGTEGFELAFRIDSEAHGCHTVRHTNWFTPRGLPHAKKDLAKVGITNSEDLDKPVKVGLICQVSVAIERVDDGREFNRVRKFKVLREGPSPFEHPDFPLDSNDGTDEVDNDIDF